jgi:coproporphyrinogen III oxidase
MAPLSLPEAEALAKRAATYFRDLQDRIVARLEAVDGTRFHEDAWVRQSGGGGRTRVLAEGGVFEKAGVAFSEVFGELRPNFAGHLPGEGLAFQATGVSLIFHPRNPYVPTVHANLRFLRRGNTLWFGGGTDLTPYYVFEEDAQLFHRGLRAICDRHDRGLYARWKAWCDRYFFLPHRQEPRGVGGLFFDYLGAGAEVTAGEAAVASSALERDPEQLFAFVRDLGDHMLDGYHAILGSRRDLPYGDRERRWQALRRGRYVEFNLLYDRGTVFGLKTDGRVESILMSLPPVVRWDYGHVPAPGSPEAASVAHIVAQRDWAE